MEEYNLLYQVFQAAGVNDPKSDVRDACRRIKLFGGDDKITAETEKIRKMILSHLDNLREEDSDKFKDTIKSIWETVVDDRIKPASRVMRFGEMFGARGAITEHLSREKDPGFYENVVYLAVLGRKGFASRAAKSIMEDSKGKIANQLHFQILSASIDIKAGFLYAQEMDFTTSYICLGVPHVEPWDEDILAAYDAIHDEIAKTYPERARIPEETYRWNGVCRYYSGTGLVKAKDNDHAKKLLADLAGEIKIDILRATDNMCATYYFVHGPEKSEEALVMVVRAFCDKKISLQETSRIVACIVHLIVCHDVVRGKIKKRCLEVLGSYLATLVTDIGEESSLAVDIFGEWYRLLYA